MQQDLGSPHFGQKWCVVVTLRHTKRRRKTPTCVNRQFWTSSSRCQLLQASSYCHGDCTIARLASRQGQGSSFLRAEFVFVGARPRESLTMKTSTTVLRCNGVGSARKWLVLAMVAAMMVSVQASSVAEAATTSTGLDNKNDLPLSLQTVIEKAQSNLRERELHPGHRVRARPAPLTVKKTTAGIARKKTPVATKKQNDSRIRKKATAGFRKKASRPKSNNRTRTGGTPPAPPSEPMGGTRGRTNARPPPRPVTTYRDPYGKSLFCFVSCVSKKVQKMSSVRQKDDERLF